MEEFHVVRMAITGQENGCHAICCQHQRKKTEHFNKSRLLNLQDWIELPRAWDWQN